MSSSRKKQQSQHGNTSQHGGSEQEPRTALTSSSSLPVRQEKKEVSRDPREARDLPKRSPSFHDVFDQPAHSEPSPEVKAPASTRRKKGAGSHAAAPATTLDRELQQESSKPDPLVKETLGHQLKEDQMKLPAETAPPIVSLNYSFIYFIRLLDNTKSDESTYKIGYSNDVPAYRKQLETEMPQNVKTMKVLLCKKGDADKLSAELCESIKARRLRSNWFRIKKEELDSICNTLVSQHQCEVVSESKAFVRVGKKPRKASN